MNNVPHNKPANFLGHFLIASYWFSGGVSLAYEVLWTRMLSIQFGVSIFGVVVTVAAFMAGLGMGSLLGSHLRQQSTRPLRLFAFLELAVACSAIIIPILLQTLESHFSLLAGEASLASWYSLQMLIVMLVLTLPALAMGAGFPLILAAAGNTRVSLGGIYGMNALGGAVGALIPLWLLPSIGWLASLYSVAGIGLLVAFVLLTLSWRFERTVEISTANVAEARPSWRWLLIYGGIGTAALMLEIAWTRLFGMVLLRTEYVLAIILAIFLLGIGMGSILARRLSHPYWFTALPMVAAAFAILSLWCLPPLASWVESGRFTSLTQALIQQGAVVAALTLPVTLVLGAWLPLLTTRLGNYHHGGVWLYGANSLGAALGTLLAGFVLIPAIGSSATIVLGAMLLLVLGLSWAHTPRAWLALIVLGVVAVPVLEMPEVSRLMPQAYADARQVSLHEDAISITHVVERGDGQRQLLADMQRMDASSDPTAVVVQMNQARLPLLLHSHPASVLFLGLGTGISAAGSLPFPDLERTAVELSLGAIQAARDEFRVVNDNITDSLTIVRDDARHYLMGDTARYDVIIGDLFHPDMVGRSALLSRQQFQRARNHLSYNGLFVQWLALNQFDLKSLQIVLRTFRQVFPDAVMFVDAFRLAMVGLNHSVISSRAVLENLERLDTTEQHQATGGEGPWTWLSRYWGPIPANTGKIQDEWAPLIEYRLPGARYNGDLDLKIILEWLLSVRPHIGDAAQSLAIAEQDSTTFEGAYAATDLAYQRWLAIFGQQPEKGQQLLPLAYQANPADRWIGFALADGVLADREAARQRGVSDRRLLESALKIRPDHVEAIRELWHLSQAAGDTVQADTYRARLAVLSPLDSEIRIVK